MAPSASCPCPYLLATVFAAPASTSCHMESPFSLGTLYQGRHPTVTTTLVSGGYASRHGDRFWTCPLLLPSVPHGSTFAFTATLAATFAMFFLIAESVIVLLAFFRLGHDCAPIAKSSLHYGRDRNRNLRQFRIDGGGLLVSPTENIIYHLLQTGTDGREFHLYLLSPGALLVLLHGLGSAASQGERYS